MCGIAGFLSTAPTGSTETAHLVAMQKALVHRGPDGRGIWIEPNGFAGFVHTRLAILDLSEAAGQPMQSASKRTTIVYNGEIYNFMELRAELERCGVVFRTRSDTEVILSLYERHGTAAFALLRGMFALAIWDHQEQIGVFARDGLGIKPLYISQSTHQVWFASELRALLANENIPRALDPTAVASFFINGSISEPFSGIIGTAVVPPGTVLVWKNGHTSNHPFWQPRVHSQNTTVHDAAKHCRLALEKSVRAHLVSDVPVALFLSGGMDSTALLMLLKQLNLAKDLHCFSVMVDDAARNESDIAQRTAEEQRVKCHVFELNASNVIPLLEEYFATIAVPTADGFNTWALTRFLRSNGFKVALSGIGGDELFGGYDSFWKIPRFRRAISAMKRSGISGVSSKILRQFGADSRARRVDDMLHSDASLSEIYPSARGIFCQRAARRLTAHFCGVEENSFDLPNTTLSTNPGNEELDQISLLEINRYMRNQLLRDSDATSMSHGIEMRVPFVDSQLVDTLLEIPARVRIRRGKRLLREAVPEIPDRIARAPKRGFTFPFAKWLGDEWPRSRSNPFPIPASHWYQRWTIHSFERWMEALRL